jgi:hypothetical protein
VQPATYSWRVSPALHVYRSTSVVNEKNDHADMNKGAHDAPLRFYRFAAEAAPTLG